MTIEAPTILGSLSFAGSAPSSVPGNLTWSDDGQAAFFTSRGIHIVTPHLYTSLAPPPAFVDQEQNAEQVSYTLIKFRQQEAAKMGQDDAMDGDEETAEAGPSSGPTRKMRRPKNGEIGWYVNGFDTKDIDRTEMYAWAEVGEESSAIISEYDPWTRAVAWSPSGLSDVGSCMLAMMTSEGQISVYSPSGDPYTKKWEEIADMTILTREHLKLKAKELPSIPEMLFMRATTMQWSKGVPLESCLGIDASLFAIANRAGKVAFWSYGPQRKFENSLTAEVTPGWVIAMDWSPWIQVDNHTCTAKLALAFSDGAVAILHVRQSLTVSDRGGLKREVSILKDEKMPDKDMRMVSGLNWLNDMLIISRPGSITLWSAQETDTISWTGCKRITLPRVGNWAGANPLSTCVGVNSIDSNSIVIALSTSVHYVITDILTAPRLADPSTMLNLSITARQLYLDHYNAAMFQRGNAEIQEPIVKSITAHVTGWGPMGEAGLISWVGELANFHNMESSSEGPRKSAIGLADLGGYLPGRRNAMTALAGLLEDCPSLTHHSPLKVLMPHLLRILVMPDQVGVCSEMEQLLASDEMAEDREYVTSSDTAGLRRAMWGNKGLDSLRLRYALTRWSSTNFKDSAEAFNDLASSTLDLIQTMIADMQLAWAASKCQAKADTDTDGPFLQLLLRRGAHASGTSAYKMVSDQALGVSLPEVDALKVDLCPACGEVVGAGGLDGTFKCAKGHEWGRCSVTHLLIAHPNYRVCSACPAVSLLPPSSTKPPQAVDETGGHTDHKRSSSRLAKMAMSDELLEAAVVCVICAGRWVRVF